MGKKECEKQSNLVRTVENYRESRQDFHINPNPIPFSPFFSNAIRELVRVRIHSLFLSCHMTAPFCSPHRLTNSFTRNTNRARFSHFLYSSDLHFLEMRLKFVHDFLPPSKYMRLVSPNLSPSCGRCETIEMIRTAPLNFMSVALTHRKPVLVSLQSCRPFVFIVPLMTS